MRVACGGKVNYYKVVSVHRAEYISLGGPNYNGTILYNMYECRTAHILHIHDATIGSAVRISNMCVCVCKSAWLVPTLECTYTHTHMCVIKAGAEVVHVCACVHTYGIRTVFVRLI